LPNRSPRLFRFKASALAATGRIRSPLDEVIDIHAASVLGSLGGFASARAVDFRHREFLSFASASTEVIGTETRIAEDHVVAETLARATIEGLNIMQMITADRVVANIASHVDSRGNGEPEVRLLGSRFEKLRIAGIPVEIDLATDLLDGAPRQSDLRGKWHSSGLGDIFAGSTLRDCLRDAPPHVTRLFRRQAGDETVMPERLGVTRMSAVRNIIPESEELKCFGHVIHVPGFGTIRLAELEISYSTRALTMIEVDLGCPVQGDLVLCAVADGTDPS